MIYAIVILLVAVFGSLMRPLNTQEVMKHERK
jgi:hypothetical protein